MKIYVDVSETVRNQLRTGIQRVVREVITHSETVKKQLGIEVLPVVANGVQFHKLEHIEQLLSIKILEEKNSQASSSIHPSLFIRVVKRMLKLIPFAYPFAIKVMHFISARDLQVDSYCSQSSVEVEQGDVLLLLDSFWSGRATLNAAAGFRKSGGTVVTVIYDVIPITHQEYCDITNVSAFSFAFPKALALSDGIVAISNAVLEEVKWQTVAMRSKLRSTLLFDYFHLGADFCGREVIENVDDNQWPESLWDDAHVFLMVGTIEPRKGHSFVLDAFEKRWKEGCADKLLILGKTGWKTEDLIKKITRSPFFGSQLFMLNHATDAELKEAYQRAYTCIMASYVEGFGLPLVEALQHGVPVIASDIPVFKEIAGNYAKFFILDDISSFDDAIDSMKHNYNAVKEKLKHYKWLTWEASTEQLLRKVKDMVLEIEGTK